MAGGDGLGEQVKRLINGGTDRIGRMWHLQRGVEHQVCIMWQLACIVLVTDACLGSKHG